MSVNGFQHFWRGTPRINNLGLIHLGSTLQVQHLPSLPKEKPDSNARCSFKAWYQAYDEAALSANSVDHEDGHDLQRDSLSISSGVFPLLGLFRSEKLVSPFSKMPESLETNHDNQCNKRFAAR